MGRAGAGQGLGAHPGARGWGAAWGAGARVPARRAGRSEAGEVEPGGESSLWVVMLIFQVGGERTSSRAGRLVPGLRA